LVDEARLERLLRETERMIVGHWSALVGVVMALLEREFLSALDLHKLIIAAR